MTDLDLSSTVPTTAAWSQRSRWYVMAAWLAFAVIACLVSIGAHMMIGLNSDHLDLLDQVRRLLAGGEPYVAYADINPPLIHILYIIPTLLSSLTGLPLYISLYALTLAITLMALDVSFFILKHSGVDRNARWVIVSALALALLMSSFIHQVFADREHLMMILVTPWFVLYSPLAQRQNLPPRLRKIAAAMAAVGFAIKPYFYIFYLATIATELYNRRSIQSMRRDVEHHIVWGFALIYGVLLVTYFHEYLLTILPVAWYTYGVMCWSLDSKLKVVWNDMFLRFAPVWIATALVLWQVTKNWRDQLFIYLYALLLACVVSYLLNGGWYYTQYPFIAMALVIYVAACGKLLQAASQFRLRNQQIFAMAAVAVIAAGGLGYNFIKPAQTRAEWDINSQNTRGYPVENIHMFGPANARVDKHLEQHPHFMFFSTSMRALNLVKDGTPRENVGRFDYFWPLPGIQRLEDKREKQNLSQWLNMYFVGTIIDDIVHNKPDMVINDISPYQYGLPYNYNILPLLKKNEYFRQAWESYHLVDSFNTCNDHEKMNCAYEIYYRK